MEKSLLGEINPFADEPKQRISFKPKPRYRAVYASPETAQRAVRRLARWMSSHPGAQTQAEAPRHIRENAALALKQLAA